MLSKPTFELKLYGKDVTVTRLVQEFVFGIIQGRQVSTLHSNTTIARCLRLVRKDINNQLKEYEKPQTIGLATTAMGQKRYSAERKQVDAERKSRGEPTLSEEAENKRKQHLEQKRREEIEKIKLAEAVYDFKVGGRSIGDISWYELQKMKDDSLLTGCICDGILKHGVPMVPGPIRSHLTTDVLADILGTAKVNAEILASVL